MRGKKAKRLRKEAPQATLLTWFDDISNYYNNPAHYRLISVEEAKEKYAVPKTEGRTNGLSQLGESGTD